jgi:hypothetical protein
MDGRTLKRSIVPVNDMNGVLILDQDEHRRPDPPSKRWATSSPPSRTRASGSA